MLSERARASLHLASVPIIVAAAVALHLVAASFGFERPYVALFIGVLATAWLVGIEAALGAVLVSAAVGHLWLYRPGPAVPGPYVSLVMFLAITMTLAGVLNSWRQALRRADAASRTKSRFLATVSHEIRTPMNAVMGMSNLLLEEPLSDEQREFAETIRSSSEALLTVLNDLLDFSKIESGRLELEHRPFELRGCVESALDTLAPGAAAKGLELLHRIEPSVPETVVGDSTRLRQILINLVGNAIKFTEQGEIELSVTARGAGGRRRLELAVRDTGIGIPPDRRGRLFESFSQADASTTRRHGGTGLGLAISKALAEAMGGGIRAESDGVPGRGSTLRVELPVEVPPAGDGPPKPGLELPGRRVLVVDDNATHREILAQELAVLGVECGLAASGVAALARLDAGERFDAALVDRDMPEMDGNALARAMRTRIARADLPLVLMIAAHRREDPADAALFDAVIKKPVKRSRLHAALASALSAELRPADGKATPPPGQFDATLAERLPLRILLAEDSPTNQRIALLMLSRLGYRADVAHNGVEALAALEERPYDLVLMDFEMPQMDGVETTRRIRARWPKEAQPRIIGLTANASREDHARSFEAGMDACLVKPVLPAELAAALESCEVTRPS